VGPLGLGEVLGRFLECLSSSDLFRAWCFPFAGFSFTGLAGCLFQLFGGLSDGVAGGLLVLGELRNGFGDIPVLAELLLPSGQVRGGTIKLPIDFLLSFRRLAGILRGLGTLGGCILRLLKCGCPRRDRLRRLARRAARRPWLLPPGLPASCLPRFSIASLIFLLRFRESSVGLFPGLPWRRRACQP